MKTTKPQDKEWDTKTRTHVDKCKINCQMGTGTTRSTKRVFEVDAVFLSNNCWTLFLNMTILFKIVMATIMLFVGVLSVGPNSVDALSIAGYAANISPEILNELKDFKDLIPAAEIDEIVAKHFLLDGNFRKALMYLNSNEFKHLQKQLLDMPEIIVVLDFLHMTINATMAHSNAAAASATDEAVLASSLAVNDNGMNKKATNAETTGTDTSTGYVNPTSSIHSSAVELETRAALAYKIPQLEELEHNIDINGAFLAELPIVDIVQLDTNDVTEYDDGIADQHPVGTFTSFVEDIIAHLPRTAYQNMIIQKCKKNAKFADFYTALRSPEFKQLVAEAMKTPHIVKIIGTLSANDIDVKSLEPIAFKVISWGPTLGED